MITLSSYSEQLKPQLNSILTQRNFKLLNKNLNFFSTQKKINKQELHNPLDELYRVIKLKAHYQHPQTSRPI